jgi:hypothetical protein
MSMADGIVVNSSGVPQKLLEIECPVKGKLNKSCLPPACDWLCKETGHYITQKEAYILWSGTTGYGNIKWKSCDLVIYSPKSKSFATIVVPFDVQFATELFKTIQLQIF